jgi:hypothetical protein
MLVVVTLPAASTTTVVTLRSVLGKYMLFALSVDEPIGTASSPARLRDEVRGDNKAC